jgi:CRISPR-associated protein Cas1
MRKLLNTLYVSSQGSYLHREGETIIVELEQKKVLQLPIHTLGGSVCFGNVLCSPYLLGFCAERDVSISFLTEYGKFLASVRGPVSGNVLLRRQQYRMADDPNATRAIAANVVTGKLANCRVVLNRTVRDHGDKTNKDALLSASKQIGRILDHIPNALDTDEVRGFEGQAAAEYFSVFDHLIIDQKKILFLQDEADARPLMK